MNRDHLPFRAVNRVAAPGYQSDLQRHHLLPRQLLQRRCFAALFERIGTGRVGFDDFRRNGLLLPANEAAALRTGLPLHRGPHRSYNELVIERVGQIEAGWRGNRGRDEAGYEAFARLALLQRALRRRLLADRRAAALLHRRDPARAQADFALLDALADQLWPATESVQAPVQAATSSAFAA
ncbi:MAG TPA: AHH domain-containing protein [Novosphingobium sp.]|nr:AHH domain-containing protein [Novosphingobium sp.]